MESVESVGVGMKGVDVEGVGVQSIEGVKGREGVWVWKGEVRSHTPTTYSRDNQLA